MPIPTKMTAEEFDALPEEEIRKWELLDGELIEKSSATPERNLILAQLRNDDHYGHPVPRSAS